MLHITETQKNQLLMNALRVIKKEAHSAETPRDAQAMLVSIETIAEDTLFRAANYPQRDALSDN